MLGKANVVIWFAEPSTRVFIIGQSKTIGKQHIVPTFNNKEVQINKNESQQRL